MSNRVEKYFLKLTSAIAVDGLILKAGHIIEVIEKDARDLLKRGKAVLAGEDEAPKPAAPVEPAAPVVEPVKEDEVIVADTSAAPVVETAPVVEEAAPVADAAATKAKK